MAERDATEPSGNWISRFVAIVLAIVAGIWLYEYSKELPEFSDELTIEEKGVYDGAEDEPLDDENIDRLQDRTQGQSF